MQGLRILHTFARAQPDLNWENKEVRQALFDAANFWLDKGVRGFRLDAIVIKFLLNYLKKGSFKVFAIYRVALGIIVLIILMTRL